MDNILESLKVTYSLLEKQEEIPLEFPKAPKSDIRTTGMMVVMFEDWNMNGSSPYKFVVETSKFRKIQGLLGLGDYGGKMPPATILSSIESLVGQVESQSLADGGDMASIYAKVTKVDNAMKILQAFKKIAEVAEVAGTDIRAVNAQNV